MRFAAAGLGRAAAESPRNGEAVGIIVGVKNPGLPFDIWIDDIAFIEKALPPASR
jgi:hypothetical protein